MPRGGPYLAHGARALTAVSAASVEPVLQRAERRIVETLGLRSRPIEPRFAHATGLWKDAPVTLTTRTYEGDAIGYLRVALVGGTQLTIGSLLACARPNRALPLLMAELVLRGTVREATITVESLSVTGDATPSETLRVVAGAEQVTAALEAFTQRVNEWIARAASAIPDPDHADAVRRRQRELLDARKADPQTRSLLAAMFGKAWSDDYVGTVLYPG